MNLALKISRRYIRSVLLLFFFLVLLPLTLPLAIIFRKKPRVREFFSSLNVINVISLITMTGMTVCTAAFVLILSVFNGFEGLVISLYDSFYSEIRIAPAEGKQLLVSDELLGAISNVPGVRVISKVIEEKALLMSDDRQAIATIKGVDNNYVHVTGMDTSMAFDDKFVVNDGQESYMVLGAGVDMALQVSLKDPFKKVSVFMPKRTRQSSFLPGGEFNRKNIMAWGIFAIQDDFDNQYVFAPLRFVQDLLDFENEIGALEISLEEGASKAEVKRAIVSLVDENMSVKTKYEQNAFLYKIMKIEKLAVYLILTFVLLIVAFNMIGSLSMIVIDKKKDIGILKTMGADEKLIKRIFLFSGLLQAGISLVIGFAIAIALILAQQYFGLISLQGSGTFVVQYYPVAMKLFDFVLVSFIVIIIATAASFFPASKAARQPKILGAG